jgi:hypothetical protein
VGGLGAVFGGRMLLLFDRRTGELWLEDAGPARLIGVRRLFLFSFLQPLQGWTPHG